jgi:hypothetical protein
MELPSDDALRWIVRAYASLRAAHGEGIGEPPLVQPTGAYFPDEFAGDVAGVARLLRRMMTFAPIADDLGIELAFVAEGEGGSVESPAAGCGSIACGSGVGRKTRARGVEEVGDGYRVFVAASDVAHPDLLTTSLARSVGGLVLGEAGEGAGDGGATERAEMASVACGFGVLLANGAAVWAKACGGLRLASATALSVEEMTVALALFVAVHGVPEGEARRYLQTTQREAFDLGVAWVASNPILVQELRERPALLETGVFDLEPVRGPIGRWLHRRKLDKDLRPVAAAPRPARTAEQVRRFEEARALVDEVRSGQ